MTLKTLAYFLTPLYLKGEQQQKKPLVDEEPFCPKPRLLQAQQIEAYLSFSSVGRSRTGSYGLSVAIDTPFDRKLSA